MLWIKRWLAPPVFPEDDEKTRSAILLNTTLLISLALEIFMLAGNLLGRDIPIAVSMIDIGMIAFCLFLRHLAHQGQIKLAIGAFLAAGLVSITLAIAMLGTIRIPVTGMYVLLVIAAALSFDLIGMILITVLCTIAIAGLILAENAGLLPTPNYAVTFTQWTTYTALFIWAGSMALSSLESIRKALRRADQEITERKQTEDALRIAEADYRAIFERAPIGIFQSTVEGRYLKVNQAMVEMYGYYSSAEMIDEIKSITTQIYVDVSSRQEFQRQIIESGEVEGFVAQNRRKDGSIFWTSTNASIVKNETGDILYYEGFIEDVTNRKLAEQKLRESEEKYRTVADFTYDWEAWHAPYGTYLYISPSCERITGYTATEFLANANLIVEIAHPDDQPNIVGHFYTVTHQAKTEDVHFDFRIITRSGELRWISHNCTAVYDKDGKWLGRRESNRDITERKLAEEEIRQLNANLEQRVEQRTRELLDAQEKLVRQEKLAVLGQMAGSVGHELRNPLAVISNAVYFLKIAQPDASDKVKEYLNIIERHIRISDKIVGDLLDFTRIKSAEHEPVSVPQLIRQTLEHFPTPESVHVALDLPEELPQAYADPQHVLQVLGNLIINACQAMSLNGGNLTVTSRAHDNMICVTIQDTGTGISPENIKKLFEPLFTTKPKGIGLGLAVSKKLIEANGGRIEVESELGQGSTFTVYLPVK